MQKDKELDRLTKVILSIRYKPHCTIAPPIKNRFGEYIVDFTFMVPDATGAVVGKDIPIRTSVLIPPDLLSDNEIIKLIRHTIHHFELHEADEWFKVNDVAVYDPHKRAS
jgi:hypothetical protein